MTDIYSSPMAQYKERLRRKRDGKLSENHSEESVYTEKDLGKYPKKRTTLEAMPEAERNRAAERIYRDKMYSIADVFKKLGDKAIERGFLSDPVTKILGAEAFIKYLQPLVDDKWTQGEWKNAFEPIVKHLNKDNHWTEDPEFVREYRYQIFADGTITNRHPYTSEHILGGSIIPKINNVILISDCIPFLALLFENDRQTRHKHIVKREDKRREKVRKSGKT